VIREERTPQGRIRPQGKGEEAVPEAVNDFVIPAQARVHFFPYLHLFL